MDTTVFTVTSRSGGRAHGDSQFSDHKLHVNCLDLKAVSMHHCVEGPPGHDCYGQHHGSVLYKLNKVFIKPIVVFTIAQYSH